MGDTSNKDSSQKGIVIPFRRQAGGSSAQQPVQPYQALNTFTNAIETANWKSFETLDGVLKEYKDILERPRTKEQDLFLPLHIVYYEENWNRVVDDYMTLLNEEDPSIYKFIEAMAQPDDPVVAEQTNWRRDAFGRHLVSMLSPYQKLEHLFHKEVPNLTVRPALQQKDDGKISLAFNIQCKYSIDHDPCHILFSQKKRERAAPQLIVYNGGKAPQP